MIIIFKSLQTDSSEPDYGKVVERGRVWIENGRLQATGQGVDIISHVMKTPFSGQIDPVAEPERFLNELPNKYHGSMAWAEEAPEPSNADKYLSIVRQLPRPTRGQTFRFIWFVANYHSWYKHLPWDSKVPFMFHLDPHAGMKPVCSETGEWRVEPLMDDDPDGSGYKWRTTESYLQQYGHWVFWRGNWDYGGDSTVGKILDESREWIEIPPSVQEAGTAYLNAYMSPRSAGFGWGTPPDKNDEQVRRKVQKRFRALSETFRQVVQDRVRQLADPDGWLDNWKSGEADEEWEETLHIMGATDSEVESMFLALQSKMALQNRDVKSKRLPAIRAAVFRRLQQLEDMRDATLRVLRLVYGD